MACRCTEKGMCERDLVRLARADGYFGNSSEDDAAMTNSLNSGKAAVPVHLTSDKESEIDASIDDVHDEITSNISGNKSEVGAAIQRVKEKYDAYCIEDDAYHAEQDQMLV